MRPVFAYGIEKRQARSHTEGIPGDDCIPQQPKAFSPAMCFSRRADQCLISLDTSILLDPGWYSSPGTIREQAEKLFEFPP